MGFGVRGMRFAVWGLILNTVQELSLKQVTRSRCQGFGGFGVRVFGAGPRCSESSAARRPTVACFQRPGLQGSSLTRNAPPPGTTVGPYVKPYCMVLGGCASSVRVLGFGFTASGFGSGGEDMTNTLTQCLNVLAQTLIPPKHSCCKHYSPQ